MMCDKMILLDEPAKRFIASLKSLRNKAGLTLAQVGELLNCDMRTVLSYESRRYTPHLRNFIRLAEILGYDLSESLNYRYYHRKISPSDIKHEMRQFGLSITELAKLTGYERPRVSLSVNMSSKGSLLCLGAVLDVIQHERNALKFRNELCRR